MSLSKNQMAKIANKMYDILPDEMSNMELSFIITSLLVQYDSEDEWDDMSTIVSGMVEIVKSIPPSLMEEGVDLKKFMASMSENKGREIADAEKDAKNDATEFMKKITNFHGLSLPGLSGGDFSSMHRDLWHSLLYNKISLIHHIL